MVDIPEQAIQAATEQLNISDMTIYGSYTKGQEAMVRRMLTAAAPYMQDAARVQALEPDFWAVHSKTGVHVGLWPNKAHADEALRECEGGTITPLFKSALEPSSRDQALEEAAQALEKWGDIYGDNAAKCVRALSSQPVADGWLPIETAPKDGTDFIGWDGKWPFRCSAGKKYELYPHMDGGPTYRDVWDGHYHDSLTIEHPTHWMPLPSIQTGGGDE